MAEMIYVYSDGGSRGNPGPAGCGVVIQKCIDGKCATIGEYHRYIGETTNNQAEYQALLLALDELSKLNPTQKVLFHLDSRLVVEQIKGTYKMKNAGLKPLFDRVKQQLDTFHGGYQFEYIPRERNAHADRLANKAMDEGMRSTNEQVL